MEPNIPYFIMCDAEGDNLLELGTATLSKAEEGFIDCHSVTQVSLVSAKTNVMILSNSFFLTKEEEN